MSRKWWPGTSTPPGITGRSANSWRQDSWIARTSARTGPGQDSPGHRYLLCAWITYWSPGRPPCRWLGPCSAPHRPSRCPGRHRVHTGNLTVRPGARPGLRQGRGSPAWPPPGVAQVYQIRLTCFAGWPSFHAPGRGTSERVQPDETLRGLPGGRLASSALPDLPERPGCWIWAGSARWASVPGPEGLRGHRQESSSTPRLANRHRAGPDTPPRAHAARLLPLDSRTWQAGPAVPGRQPSLCRQMAELENRAGSLDWERSPADRSAPPCPGSTPAEPSRRRTCRPARWPGWNGRRGNHVAPVECAAARAAAVVVIAAVAGIAFSLAQSAPALAFDIPLHAQYGGTASGHAVAHQMADGWSIQLTVHGLTPLPPGRFYECWYAGPDNGPGHRIWRVIRLLREFCDGSRWVKGPGRACCAGRSGGHAACRRDLATRLR